MSNALVLNLPLPVRYRLALSSRFFYLIFLLAIPFLVFYVFQTSSMVSESYQLQKYQKEIDELSAQNKFLEISSVKVNSLESIDRKAQELGFEKIGKIYYIQILDGAAVTRK